MDSMRLRRANVLAVDDQPANLVAVDAVLSGQFNVIRAHSGAQALEIVSSRSDIDVILMDVQMPEMDGFEAAALVKKLPGCQDIPIVFITAFYREDPFVKQGYEVGAVDYFSKPFDPDILRVKVGIYAAFRQKMDLLREWERQVRESEELLRAGRRFAGVLERLRMGVIVTDAHGAIRCTNTEAIDESVLAWWEADGRLRATRAGWMERILAKGEPAHETLEVRGADEERRSILCTTSPLRRPDGSLAGAIVIVRDVSERNRLELDLEQRIRHLMDSGVQPRAS